MTVVRSALSCRQFSCVAVLLLATRRPRKASAAASSAPCHDQSGGVLPGVTVTVTGPALMGMREAT